MIFHRLKTALLFASLCCLLLPLSLPAQRPGAAASSYEYTAKLQASQILQPGLMSTPLYRVRDLVVTDGGVNTFAIDSDQYGQFLAHGNTELLERMAEIVAMKRIDDMKRTKAYAKAVDEATDRETDASEEVVTEPVSPIEKEPFTGIGKFLYRLGKDNDDVEARDIRDYHAFQGKSALAMAKAKRDLCGVLGVNPYTTNLMLQRKLDDVSKAIGIGGFKMTPAALPPDDSLASAIHHSQITPELSALVYAKDRDQLRTVNQAALQQIGANATDAVAFLSNATFTPWQQTEFITALQSLPGVAGREILVRDAARSSTEETDAVFYAETAQLLAMLATQNNWKIARIGLSNGLPYCILRDGSVLMALHWDYARWSPPAEQCANWLQTLQVDGKKPASVTLAISGLASPRCHSEMEKRGLKLLDRQFKGPLN